MKNILSKLRKKSNDATENKHFNPHFETRIKCDASRKSPACAFEHRRPDVWQTVAFASSFLNRVEK